MNTTTNFSINDPDINKYFKGDDSNPPIRELIYIHTHPLIRPNFVNEIDILVQSASERLKAKKVDRSSRDIMDIQDACIRLGQSIGTLEIKDPLTTLSVLRDIYNICNRISRG